MSHSTPVQDSNTPYGLNLGRPLNESAHQFEQNQYANSSSTTGRDASQAIHSTGAQQAQQYSSHHPSTGLNSSTFPQESDTLSRGEAGQYGTESQARRGDFVTGEGEGVTRGGFVASQANEDYASTATLEDRNRGVPVGGYQQQQYATSGQQQYPQQSSNDYSSSSNDNEYGREHHHRGNHSAGNPRPEDINATETIRKGGPSGRDATIAGFNPKDTHNIDSAPIRGKDVERMSTPGPHGLVWLADQHKYVHRRELDGDTSAAAEALHRKKREASGSNTGSSSRSGEQYGSSSRSGQQYGSDDRSNPNYNASAGNPTQGTASGAPVHSSRTANAVDPRTQQSGNYASNTGSQGHYHPGHAADQSSRAVGVSPAGTESHGNTTSRYDGRPEQDAHAHQSETLNKMDPRVNADSRGNNPVAANSGHHATTGSSSDPRYNSNAPTSATTGSNYQSSNAGPGYNSASDVAANRQPSSHVQGSGY